MSTIIEVNDLSKSFTLHHEGNERYTAMRDVVTNKAKKVFSFPRNLKPSHANVAKEEFWALKDVSFKIEQGDRIGIIGRNGAGKSTLLKILSRITEPSKGSIKIKGRVASLLEVGTGFHPELTGRENIYLNGAILGMSRNEIKKKFDEIVDFAEVEKFLDTPVKRYSSGMYVRLAFAVAAHLEPEILVVDEVLAVGDTQFQRKCLGKMEDVSLQKGRTVLFVSHNMTAIANLCNQMILLRSGSVVHNGDLDRGINMYLNTNSDVDSKLIFNQFLQCQSDECFQLTSIKLCQEGIEKNVFSNEKELEIKLGYNILKACTGLRVGFDITDKVSGSVIFRSFHDDSYSKVIPFDCGKHTSTFKIIPYLLKEGDYYFSLAVGIHNVRWIIHDTLKLEFSVTNVSGINKLYADIRPGVIMPKLFSNTAVNK